MAVRIWNGSAWVDVIAHVRAGDGTWTDDNDIIRFHDGASFVTVQPAAGGGGGGSLAAPVSLHTTTIDDSSIKSVWTSPGAQGATHFQARVTELTTVYDEQDIAFDGQWTVGGLLPNTDYHIEVRYIIRLASTVSSTSPTATVLGHTTFTAPSIPADDPGGGAPAAQVITTFPGITGTPGTVGSGGCWHEWKLQTLVVNGLFGFIPSFVDFSPAVGGTFSGLLSTLTYDMTGKPNGLYRFAGREVCNSVPGAWTYGVPFTNGDLSAPCGAGAKVSASYARTGYSDAKFFIPKLCAGNGVHDSVSDLALDRGAGLLNGWVDSLGDCRLVANYPYSDGAPGHDLVSGTLPNIALMTGVDYSVTGTVLLAEPILTGHGTNLISLGGGGAIIAATPGTGSGFKIAASFILGGSTVTLTSVTELSVNAEHSFALVVDQDANKTLWIDGVAEATNAAGTATGAFSAFTIRVSAPQGGQIWNVAGWARALSAVEVGATSSAAFVWLYTTPGTYEWVVPQGTPDIVLELAGAAGAGSNPGLGGYYQVKLPTSGISRIVFSFDAKPTAGTATSAGGVAGGNGVGTGGAGGAGTIVYFSDVAGGQEIIAAGGGGGTGQAGAKGGDGGVANTDGALAGGSGGAKGTNPFAAALAAASNNGGGGGGGGGNTAGQSNKAGGGGGKSGVATGYASVVTVYSEIAGANTGGGYVRISLARKDSNQIVYAAGGGGSLGSTRIFQVPTGAKFLDLEVTGASGKSSGPNNGGKGGKVTGRVAVLSNAKYELRVGETGVGLAPNNRTFPDGGKGRDGPSQGQAGGGRSDFRPISAIDAATLLIGGGGGGAGSLDLGSTLHGGDGGYPAGGGLGGTQSAGGVHDSSSSTGQDGAQCYGGDCGIGTTGGSPTTGGGGGGGGWYGGAGYGTGLGAGPGGGGSSYAAGSVIAPIVFTNGVQTGAGTIKITLL